MGKFLLDITEGWLEFKKCSPYRFVFYGGSKMVLGTLIFDFKVQELKLKEISNYLEDGG